MKFNLNLENINYIKITYKNLDESPSCVKAAIKSIDDREIVACAKFEEELRVQIPQNINLSIICDNGLYRTNTTLKYVENAAPYAIFILKIPEGLEYQQNREYFRVKMQEDVIISYKIDNDIIRIPCKSYDISSSGIRVEIDKAIENVEELYIDILFPNKEIKVLASLVRTDCEDGISKASFKFLNIKETDIDIISQKCIQKQLEYKRNNAR